MKLCTLALAASLLVTPMVAQGCPTGQVMLSVSPASAPPGDTVMVAVTGSAGAWVRLFSDDTLGQSTLMGPGPLNGTTICLDSPGFPRFLGRIPMSGTLTRPTRIPLNAPVGSSVHYQAVTLESGTGGATVDTSGTASVSVAMAPPPPPCAAGNVGLDIQPNGPVMAGGTITWNVTGTPGAFVFLVQGRNQGSTMLNNVTVCLDSPFRFAFFGTIPMGGTLTRTRTVPMGAMLPGNRTRYYQAIEVSGGMGMPWFDTSNVDSLTF